MRVPVPLGDVVDRVTICLLKVEQITDEDKAAHARAELDALRRAWAAEGLPPMDALPNYAELARLNAELWKVEDALRRHERNQEFGEDFVALARSVYQLNDRRAAAKQAINRQLGSDLYEVKSYRID